ncbi:oxysterol-binding protein-related protein 10-like protein, partial [Lates japonicus]
MEAFAHEEWAKIPQECCQKLVSGYASCLQYFVLDPEVGQLQYYLNELSKSQRPPRGSLPLLGAMVVSSNDFPYMFTVQSTTGVSYKLR